MEHIPIVDISKITRAGDINEDDYNAVAKEVFEALKGIGFVYLKGHGVDEKIIEKAFTTSRTFFDLPQDVKDRSLKDIGKSYHGYAKPGQEVLHPSSKYEHRESYDFCAKNRFFPDEDCPEFGPALKALELACMPVAKHLLRIMATSMGLEDKNFFVSRCKNLDDPKIESYTTFRSLFYPTVPDDVPAGTVRLGDHSDYGILSMVFQDDVGGLQVKSTTGKWIEATPIPGTILINTGDLLEFWTGGVFPATRHRILISADEKVRKAQRQSIGFFVHPDDDLVVKPLIGDSKEYAPVFAKEHAERRTANAHLY